MVYDGFIAIASFLCRHQKAEGQKQERLVCSPKGCFCPFCDAALLGQQLTGLKKGVVGLVVGEQFFGHKALIYGDRC